MFLFSNKRKHTSNWEYIGSISYGNKAGNIPKWVLDAERKISQKYGGTSSSLLDKMFYLKGKHFRYRLSYSGQGGCIVTIERRERHKQKS